MPIISCFMKIIYRLFCVLMLVHVGVKAQDNKGSNPEEKKVLRLINALPEVIAENKFRKKAGYKSLLRAYIQNTPSKEHDYYSVTVSEEKNERLFTYDWYEVNPNTYVIRYWDFINDKTMSLQEWRKQLRAKSPKKVK